VSLAFLSPGAADSTAVARSPMEGKASAAGARFEVREGWSVAVEYPDEARVTATVAWADVSHLPKWELRGAGVGGELGTARREGEAWWCGVTADRVLVIGDLGRNVDYVNVSSQAPGPEGAIDVTTCFAALTIFGPHARETIARFCALDLRPQLAPPGSFRPGSIARQPGMILVQDTDRFLLLFGWAVGEYMWTVVADSARSLDGGPVGWGALNTND
jgi:glycine cleavage system aminomethyltransferase T